jgi:protein required for attachment to host cells
MPKTGILVADGARARFLTLQAADELIPERGPQLIEQLDLANPEGDLPDRELFSDRGGRMHGSVSSGSDDHREQHKLEIERRFARRLIDEARRFAREQELTQLVLAAAPTLLGLLRPELERQPLVGVRVVELAENVVRKSAKELGNLLTTRGLMSRSITNGGGLYRPRGQPPALR